MIWRMTAARSAFNLTRSDKDAAALSVAIAGPVATGSRDAVVFLSF